MSDTQSVKAVAKYIRMSPHKIRRVLDHSRSFISRSIRFLPYDAGGPIWQVVHSAGKAKHNYGLDKKTNH
jgi:large subunit ribosomal protein L22